jgi:hypothetical protein
MCSTTTFGTQDDTERSPSRGAPVQDVAPGDEHGHENETADVFGALTLMGLPQDSWFVDDVPPPVTARHSPVEG